MARKPPREEEEEVWFEPKLFGYGSGLPVAWQGWALLLGYIALLMGLISLVEPAWRMQPVLAAIPVVAILVLTIFMVRVSARHTRGGWHWRWGGRD